MFSIPWDIPNITDKTMDSIRNKIIYPANFRKIQLQGANNFRDLGGYSTAFGEKTLWGKLFRSDNLAKLTADDLIKIETRKTGEG